MGAVHDKQLQLFGGGFLGQETEHELPAESPPDAAAADQRTASETRLASDTGGSPVDIEGGESADVNAVSGRTAVQEQAARDFIVSLAGEPSINRFTTVVQVERRGGEGSVFRERLVGGLSDAGYPIQYVPAGVGDSRLTTDYRETDTNDGARRADFSVRLGRFDWNRGYLFSPDADAAHGDGDATPPQLPAAEVGEPVIGAAVSEATPAPVAVDATEGDEGRDRGWSETDFGNLVGAESSVYQGVFGDYINVSERILVFQKDSAFVGEANRDLARRFIGNFDADRDIVYLLACSNGDEADDIDHREMARQRAANVKDFLVAEGIPASRVFEEGCWTQGDTDLRYPLRATVMTLKRLR